MQNCFLKYDIKKDGTNMWQEINDQAELDAFMALFGGFHDSCIKEFKYTSGAYVEKGLGMHPINDERSLKVIFQRQYLHPTVIEIEFMGLSQLKISPTDKYTCEIGVATMKMHEEGVYWYDEMELPESDLSNFNGTLICAAKVRWREADEYIGDTEVYQSR